MFAIIEICWTHKANPFRFYSSFPVWDHMPMFPCQSWLPGDCVLNINSKASETNWRFEEHAYDLVGYILNKI